MPPLRLLLIVLLLLNLLALAAGLGWLGSSSPRGEPERLTNQVDPDRIQLQMASIDEKAATPTASPRQARETAEASSTTMTPETAEVTSTPPSSQPAPPAREAAQIEPQTTTAIEDPAPIDEQVAQEEAASPLLPEDEPRICISFARLSEERTSAIENMARDTDPLIASTAEMTDPPDAWWVRIPPTGSRQAAEQRAAQLRTLGINDLFIVRAEGPNQYAISLGIFRTESRARQHFSDLAARRVRGAEIAPRTPPLYRIQLSGPQSLIEALNSRVVQAFPDTIANECAP